MIEQEYKFVDIEIAGTKLIHPFSIKDEGHHRKKSVKTCC